MARSLRHVTIPDVHNRIPDLRPEAVEAIAAATTEKLQETVRVLVAGITMSDEQWAVLYRIKDELLERGEWDEELTRIKSRSRKR